MVGDPLYRSIEKGLDERLDPELFERCAVELLREVYPGIVPIPGGDDGGMDGAISSGTGAPLPLVVTTSSKVLRNLTRSLDRYQRVGGSARQAVLATSQALTPPKRRNLEKRASELGFTLRNIHEQADFVGRLYRNPTWRKQLLGLTGQLPALSALPDKAGLRLTMRLEARDRELDWLRRARGDVVVVGQPGVGKTALLEALAREGGGLFPIVSWSGGATVVTFGDMSRIADAYRAERPPRVFVDDAHLRGSLIQNLARLRDEIGAEFTIVATTWPSYADEVRRELYCPSEHILRVEGLDRTTAGKVVRQVHAGFPDDLVGEILNQSVDNLPADDPLTAEYHSGGHVRPGLAVTLARSASLGEVTDLATGKLLLQEVRKDAGLTGSHLDYLGAFAIGGSAGVQLARVAEALREPETRVRGALHRLSGTGLLREAPVYGIPGETPGRPVSVHPRHLRLALVARTFFSGTPLSLEPVLSRVEDAIACTETLIVVLAREGRSLGPETQRQLHDLIRAQLEKQESPYVGSTLWTSYARTGADAASWILDEHPDRTALISAAALRHAPDRCLGGLVSRALDHPREADALTKSIRAWILAGEPGGDAVERRESLVRALVERTGSVDLNQAGRRVVTELLAAAFSLSFEMWRDDPIKIIEISIGFGSLPASDARKIGDLWALALPVFRGLGRSGVSCARTVAHDWLIGSRAGNKLDDAQVTAREQVRRMLPAVLNLASHEPGILLWAHRLANEHRLGVRLPEVDDSTLRRLFPNPAELDSRDSSRGPLDATAREFARKWRHKAPKAVVTRLMHCERQRDLMGHNYSNVLDHLPIHLAQQVGDPAAWLQELVDRDAPPQWVGPFLEAATVMPATSEQAWEAVARDDRYTMPFVRIGLRDTTLPGTIVDCIMQQVQDWTVMMVSHSIDWNTVAREWKHRLLRHPEPTVRGAVAGGIWESNGRRRPGGRLGIAWQNAVVTCRSGRLMSELLQVDAGIARAWILSEARASPVRARRRRLASDSDSSNLTLAEWEARVEQDLEGPSLDEGLLATARHSLDLEDRRDLISAIPEDANPMFFRYLVGDDPDLYAVLLRRQAARDAHLAPLGWPHSGGREALVREATRHGYSRRDIDGW